MSIPSLRENVLLKPYTSFKVGGPAQWFCEPSSTDELAAALQFAQHENLPCTVIGKGSNIVVSDSGIAGLVVRLGDAFSTISQNGNTLQVAAGALLHSVVQYAIRQSLGGIEKLGGVPGTMGGAAFINAGAYGQEIGDRIVRVETITPKGELREYLHKDCHFTYRHTRFCELNEIITHVELDLVEADSDTLKASMQECLKARKEKQPLELPNAGSMFKRPPGMFAGALIEASGLKGYTVGGAQVSVKHAGFVVNIGNATADDIWQLTENVITKVKADHGVQLEREVIFLGRNRA